MKAQENSAMRNSISVIDMIMRVAGGLFTVMLVSSLFVNLHVSSDIHVSLSNGIMTHMVGALVQHLGLMK